MSLDFNFYTEVKIKPKMTNVLKEKSGCEDISFWSSFQEQYTSRVQEKCNNSCTSRSLPNAILPQCETLVDMECADEQFEETLMKMEYHNYKPCSKLEYEGRIDRYDHASHIKAGQVKFFIFIVAYFNI